MANWETADDGWETAGWEEAPSAPIVSMEEASRSAAARNPFPQMDKERVPSTMDKAKGVGQTSRWVLNQLLASPLTIPLSLVQEHYKKKGETTPNIDKVMEGLAPTEYMSPEGKDYTEDTGKWMSHNLPALMHISPAADFVGSRRTPKKGAPRIEPKADWDAIIQEEVAVKPKVEEQPVKPIPTEAQMELPDSAMIHAPQYGVMEGMARIDENGMPIKADKSMEAQNLQNPLQRNLWGDELGPALDQQRSLTEAIDLMRERGRTEQGRFLGKETLPNALGREVAQTPELRAAIEETIRKFESQEGPFSLPEQQNLSGGMGRRQAGQIDMAWLDPAMEKIKQLSNGIKLVMRGAEEGPRVIAYQAGKQVGELKLGPREWANPTADTNMVAAHVESKRPGLAQEMYKFAAEQRNDIEASPVQTSKGREMWDKFRQSGLAQKDLIKQQEPVRDLGSMSADLLALDNLLPHNKAAADAAANVINHGLGGRQRGALLIPGKKPPKPDTEARPTSPEMVAKKQELEKKAAALKLKDTPYEQVRTFEDAKANPGPDLSNNQVRDYLASGIGGQIARNTKNRLLKFARTMFEEGKQLQESFSTRFVTGPNGVNKAFRKLADNEWNDVAVALQAGSRNKVRITESMMDKQGFTPAQKELVNKIYTGLDEMYVMANDALMSQGFQPIKYHEGYVPSMFTGAYTSLVRKGDKTVAVVQADTKWGWKKGKEYFGEDVTFIDLPRQGLNTRVGYNRVFNGFSDVVAQLAKLDPEFAKLKQEVDHRIAQNIKKLYEFDVHEKRKTGVQGALGDKPWLDQKQNAKDFLEGLINYFEEGSNYYSLQKPLNEVGKLLADPELQVSHPNTLRYLDEYSKHNKGHNLSSLGAAMNAAIDIPFKLAGVGPKVPENVLGTVRTASTVHMMGLWNPGFLLTQLTQYWTGGLPEAAAIRNRLGLTPQDLVASWGKMTNQFAAIGVERMMKKEISGVDPHMREAFRWAEEQGMLNFSEVELAKDVLRPEAVKKIKDIASWPITLGEKATRPAIFMWYTDLFHRAGITPDAGLYSIAKQATDYAMTNYHPSERPMIYSSLGYMGQFTGALTTYKHNLIEQWIARGKDAKNNPAALGAMLGTGFMFYGLMGFPGAQEADQIFQQLTGKTIREAVLEKSTESNAFMDGVLSTTTGLDFQARLSMASVIPDTPAAGLAGPHLSNAANIMMKGITYALDQDEASKRAFVNAATPLGMRGMVEEGLMTDEQGFLLDKEGQRKYSTKRGVNAEGIDERLWRKWMGMRPIRERLEDEDLYADDKAYKKMTDKQRSSIKRFKAALNFNDEAGAQDALQEYMQEGGDPNNLKGNIKKFALEKGLSARQRRIIAPKNSIGSVNKYREYND